LRRKEFEKLVEEAIASLPGEIRQKMENLTIVVEDFPTDEQLEENGYDDPYDLLGLYEGTPLPERTSDYNAALPDVITLFQRPLEDVAETREELIDEIATTVVHEVAHYFGIDEDRLEELGWD
jgi:predicted Zn-dependent protease with MMP-like domain